MIYGFMHVALMNNGYDIFKEQVYKIQHTGLYDKCEKIFIGCVHDVRSSAAYFKNLPSKFELVIDHGDLKIYEILTLNYLINFCKNQDINCKVFYVHTKGASRIESKYKWRKYMEYFNIVKHKTCIDALNKYDICGVNWQKGDSGRIFFDGNFWWANSKFVKRCQTLSEKRNNYSENDFRCQAEAFLSKHHPNYKDLFPLGKLIRHADWLENNGCLNPYNYIKCWY